MTAACPPETLARRRGRCRLCSAPILPGEHYVTKLDRLGWVHAECAAGYRRVLAEHEESPEDPTAAVRAELTAVAEAVGVAFNRLPLAAQATIDVARNTLEAEVDAAILAEDHGRASAAIRAWRGHWLGEIERAGSACEEARP